MPTSAGERARLHADEATRRHRHSQGSWYDVHDVVGRAVTTGVSRLMPRIRKPPPSVRGAALCSRRAASPTKMHGTRSTPPARRAPGRAIEQHDGQSSGCQALGADLAHMDATEWPF